MIVEGLKEGDLDNLVGDTISIDEYESKIDDSAIVVGFYVFYKDPALDLNKFIQKIDIDIIDTDVSPAPTEDGYYIVFVELERNKKLYDNIISLVDTVSNLSGIDAWFFTSYNNKNKQELNIDNLKNSVDITLNNDTVADDLSEQLYDYFKESILDDMIIHENKILFSRNGKKICLNIIDFGDIEKTRYNSHLAESAIIYNFSSSSLSSKISNFLGPNWIVEILDECISIRKDNNVELLVGV